jgi:hypothetical protein
MATIIADIIKDFAIGAGIGSAIAPGIGTIIGGIGGILAGIIEGGLTEDAQKKADAQTRENVGDFSSPGSPGTTWTGGSGVGVAGGTTGPGLGGSPAGGGGGAGAGSPNPVATDEAAIAKERYAEAGIQINATQEQLGQTILNQKIAEVQSEGSIRAYASGRGLKMEGSPLMQMIVQQQIGAQTEAFTERQGVAAIAGMGLQRQSAYDAAALSGKETLQYADTQLSNAWLTSFTNAINTATSMVSSFWNPSTENKAVSDTAFFGGYNYGGGGNANAFGGGFGYG